jgi:hypothetical protein
MAELSRNILEGDPFNVTKVSGFQLFRPREFPKIKLRINMASLLNVYELNR